MNLKRTVLLMSAVVMGIALLSVSEPSSPFRIHSTPVNTLGQESLSTVVALSKKAGDTGWG
ncbi:hypothetical protein [Streptomyces sp. NPDC096132]|uniref:hypothetical protein n=1 Tax=Streptomyces sp. NPDC096132 TaxID=3366075 RepID=UPI00381FD410